MSADQNLLDNLNNLDLGRVGNKALEGAAWGIKICGSIAAPFATVFPPAGAVAMYWGIIFGTAAGVLNALFSKDPAVFRREQAQAAEAQANANIALNNMFQSWPVATRSMFVQTPMYQALAAAAKSPDKYQDPLAIYDAHPEIRERLRESIRLATIDKAHPDGIIFGDAIVRAQIGDRLAAFKKAEITKRVEVGASLAGLATLGGGVALWWKRRQEAQRARENGR